MTKLEKIDKEISKLETEMRRLKRLALRVEGNVVRECPICKTRNSHWNLDDTWTCSFC